MTIQDALDEIRNKLDQSDEMDNWQASVGALIIAVEQLKLVVEAVIRYQHIDTGEKKE